MTHYWVYLFHVDQHLIINKFSLKKRRVSVEESWLLEQNVASPKHTDADVALKAVQIVVSWERYAWVVQQVVLLLLVEVKETEEYKGPVFAVWSQASAHVVDVTVELGYEDVYILAAIVFWKRESCDLKSESNTAKEVPVLGSDWLSARVGSRVFIIQYK